MILAVLVQGGCVPGAVLREMEIEAGGMAAETVALPVGEVRFERFELTVLDLRLHEPLAAAWLGLPGLGVVGTKAARAHPGHEGAGDVRGELPGAFPLDLLRPPISLGTAQVYSGQLDSLSLGVGAAELRGTLQRDGQSLPFAFALDLGGERVEGIVLGLDLPAEGPAPRLVLRGDPSSFVARSLLAQAEDTDGDGALGLADGSLENSLAFGLRSTTIWTVSAVKGDEDAAAVVDGL